MEFESLTFFFLKKNKILGLNSRLKEMKEEKLDLKEKYDDICQQFEDIQKRNESILVFFFFFS